MMKLSIEWRILDGKKVALIFDPPTWAMLQLIADERGISAKHLVSEAIAKLFGSVVGTRERD
jgi:hypothetical protein